MQLTTKRPGVCWWVQVTGAKQVYTAALGASFPHFHCHMVPVFPDTVVPVRQHPPSPTSARLRPVCSRAPALCAAVGSRQYSAGMS